MAIALGVVPWLPVSAQPASARSNPRLTWVIDGSVDAVAAAHQRVYIGGSFNYVGRPTGPGVVLSRTTGSVIGRSAGLHGEIDASVSDGRGGYYIGGWFTRGPSAGHGLAHVRSDGRIDRQWAGENANGDAQSVDALARSGSRLYVGGSFDHINGLSRSSLAAIDTRTGAVNGWQPRTDHDVNALAVAGSTVYVGGQFDSINGQKRDGLAAVSARTGAVSSWNPYRNAFGHQIFALAISGSVIYVGGLEPPPSGDFDRPYVQALHVANDRPTIWKVNPGGGGELFLDSVDALAVLGSRVYVGGEFSRVEGRRRNSLVALDRRNGHVTAWDPGADSVGQIVELRIYHLAASGSTLYAGGWFTSIGGRQRTNIAALSTHTGRATSWQPGADQSVSAISVSPSSVYVGGDLNSIGGWQRRNLVVFDTRTRSATPFSLEPNDRVNALASSGSRLYLGGNFTRISGRRRDRLAAINTRSGRLTDWDPSANRAVDTLAATGTTLDVGGAFTTIDGVPRRRVAALPFLSDRPTPWNPGADGAVLALAATPTLVYAGGRFRHIGGRARRYIAALDSHRGVATGWNPRPEFSGDCDQRFGSTAGCDVGAGILALAVSRSLVYAGGVFTAIGRNPFAYLAALNPHDGRATSWNPDVGDVTWQVRVTGSTLFAGGNYGLLAFSPATHQHPTWKANLDTAFAFAVSGPNAYVGGESSQFSLENVFEVFRLPRALAARSTSRG